MATTLDEAFREVVNTLEAHLTKTPGDPKARYLSALVLELGARSKVLHAAASCAPESAEGCASAVMGIWRDLVRHDALTSTRALALARRLADVIAHPAALAFLAEEARPHDRAVKVLHDAVRRRFPDYELELPRIDKASFEALGVPIHRLGVTVRFHPNGHLALLASMEARLTLDEQPGRGRFVDRGVTRGSGWAVDERYAQGCASGAFFSPWHDGSAYSQPTSFLVWVAKAAMSVCLAADRAEAKTSRRKAVPSKGAGRMNASAVQR